MSRSEDREVAFFGKITAGITHEIKNVLAIIQQASGLMEDIISISPEALILHQDKIQLSLSKIKDQIQRGVELTNRLNKFAHSTDESIAEVDLFEITEQLMNLSMRFARNQKVALKIHPADQTIPIATYPIRLQGVLFKCIECCLSLMPSGGQIDIYPRKSGERQEVSFLCEGEIPAGTAVAQNLSVSEKWPVLQEAATALGGSAETDASAPGILLRLPFSVKP